MAQFLPPIPCGRLTRQRNPSVGREGEGRGKEMNKRIVIAICTRGISPNLKVLLAQLQDFLRASSFHLRVIIVWDSELDVPDEFKLIENLSIIKSEKSGYASVRNAALKKRYENENVLFIDDDERIQPITDPSLENQSLQESFFNILNSYLDLAKHYNSSIFVGKVLPISLQGDLLFDYRNRNNNLSHGQVMNYASAGNLFIPSDIFAQATIEFDEYFNFGGEDSDLCKRLQKSGISTRWNESATLFEVTPPERLSLLWQLKRRKKNFVLNTITQRRNLRTFNLICYFIESCAIYFFHRIFFVLLKENRTELIQVEKKALRYLITGDISILSDSLHF